MAGRDAAGLIHAVLTSRWQKTALVVGNALSICGKHGLSVQDEILGAGIRAMAESKRIESVGDLGAWGHSEVRLKY